MDEDELRQHIEAAVPGGGDDARRLAALILGACWPGGPEDRTERAAIHFLRHRHPSRAAVELPACSCATGRCLVCN